MNDAFSLDVFGEWYDADGNADEIRLWTTDGTLLAQLTNDYDHENHAYVTYTVSASDVFPESVREECSNHRDWWLALFELFDNPEMTDLDREELRKVI